MKNNIILIGFMGVGKGTVAREYARRHALFNIDTDDLIESAYNMKIKEMFQTHGEAYFRQKEQECANWIEASLNNTLISCGGGFYKVENLKNLGRVVLLDASYDWIYKRLKNAPNGKKKLAKRPLFQEPKKAKELYKERKKAYLEVADIVIKIEGKELPDIVAEIKKKTEQI
jgi:shikimate kinase